MPPRPTSEQLDRREFERAVSPFLGRLQGFLARRSRHEHAEDLLQESILRAWQQWDALRDRGALRSWLFQIALRTLLEDARRNARREQLVPVVDLEPEFVELVASPAPTSLELLIERASDEAVWNALGALPRELGLALELYEVEELSYAEVAAALQLPIGTVMSRIHRARRQLAVILTRRELSAVSSLRKVEHGAR